MTGQFQSPTLPKIPAGKRADNSAKGARDRQQGDDLKQNIYLPTEVFSSKGPRPSQPIIVTTGIESPKFGSHHKKQNKVKAKNILENLSASKDVLISGS